MIRRGFHRGTRPFLAAVLVALAACGTETEEVTGFDVARQGLSALTGGGEPSVPDAREVLTPALLAQADTPVLLAVFQETDTGFTLLPLAQTGEVVQWRDATNAGLFLRDGILIGSRGYGFDLWSADIAPLRAALQAGGGEDVVRVNRYLDGENQIVRQQFFCSVQSEGSQTLSVFGRTVTTEVYRESCAGDGPDFENRYWVNPAGKVVKSLELVSPRVGAIDLTLLVE